LILKMPLPRALVEGLLHGGEPLPL
jgi:hypothetical protein